MSRINVHLLNNITSVDELIKNKISAYIEYNKFNNINAIDSKGIVSRAFLISLKNHVVLKKLSSSIENNDKKLIKEV